MAFCRWSENSDVYMYYSSDGYWCSNCLLEPDEDRAFVKLNSSEAAARHLRMHRDAGHKVPPGTIASVLADGETNGC